jgi:hypothetical protein
MIKPLFIVFNNNPVTESSCLQGNDLFDRTHQCDRRHALTEHRWIIPLERHIVKILHVSLRYYLIDGNIKILINTHKQGVKT